MPITFISYRREDSTGYAGRLHEELAQRLGDNEVFRDLDTLRPGQDFVDGIGERLKNCGTLVAMIGRTWLNVTDESGARRLDRPDDYVVMEIGEALARRDVLVVPVLVGGATMPEPQQLPERIRALGRKQALVLRDDTWEQDVDRLAAILAAHTGARGGAAFRTKHARSVPGWAIAAVATLLVLATIGFVALRDGEEPAVSKETPAPVTAAPVTAAPAVTPSAPAPSPPPTRASAPPAVTAGAPQAIDIKANPEVAHGDAIFTILTGSILDRGEASTLWLRIRASNEARTAMVLTSDYFRLSVAGQTLSSTTSFAEALPAFSLTQKLVSFQVPSGERQVELRIIVAGVVARIPLDLRPSGRPAIHDQVDTGDALSRASVSTLISSPRRLLTNGDLSTTLLRVTRRRFANLQRLTATVRYENAARVDQGSWMVVLHIVDGEDVIAPFAQPSVAVRALATFTGDSVIDVPASATSVQLRATAGQERLLIPLNLP